MTVIGQDENIVKELEARQKLIPFVPSTTSYGMGWKTLQAARYRKSPASGEFSFTPSVLAWDCPDYPAGGKVGGVLRWG